MKGKLKSINIAFKEKIFDLLQSKRSQIINHLNTHEEDYLKLNELKRYVEIYKYVAALCFYNDDEVKDVVRRLSLKKYTPKVFMSYLYFFKSLDQYHEESKYLYPYEVIWGFYELYSLSVIKEKMVLDFNIDISAIARKVNRQLYSQSFPPILTEAIEDIHILNDLIKKEIPSYKMDISVKNPLTSVTHKIKYSHKNDLHNLYNYLVDFNKELNSIDFNESDFKVEFYDLLEIILREKELLNNSEEAISNYETLRRFKIKRVERLILS